MNNVININMKQGKHKMDFTKQIGDVQFFECPLCDYERTINVKTGELTRSRDSYISHYGFSGFEMEY